MLNGIQLTPEQLLLIRANTPRIVSGFVSGTAAATATNYGLFFVADRSYAVISITERHLTAGTDAGAVTLTVEKCPSGTAPDSGSALLATAFDLKGTANTVQYGALTLTKLSLRLTKGDSLVLKDAGTLTAVADVCVTVLLLEL